MIAIKLSFVLLAVHLSFSLAQPPPPPPRVSNSFSTKIRQLNAGVVTQGELFINHELNKELQIIELGSTTNKDAGKVHILDIGSTKKEYQLLEPFDFCIIPPVEVTLHPVWSWLVNATLKGTEKFQGKDVNVWILKNKRGEIIKEAGFLALDEDTPVYIVGSDTGGPMIFDDYKNRAPPASNFTIPGTCTKSSHITPQDHITNTVFGKALRKFRIT